MNDKEAQRENICLDERFDIFIRGFRNSGNNGNLISFDLKYLDKRFKDKGYYSVNEFFKDYSVFAKAKLYRGDFGNQGVFNFSDELFFHGCLNIFKKDNELNFMEDIFYSVDVSSLNFHEKKGFFGENPLRYLIFRNSESDYEKSCRIDRIIKGYNEKIDFLGEKKKIAERFFKNLRETSLLN